MEDDTARQYKASHDFALAYEWIFCSIVGVLTLRNIVTCIHQWHHLRRIAQSSTTTLDEKGPSSHSHAMRPSLVTRVEATLLHPLFWIITPVELLIILATFSINVGFVRCSSPSLASSQLLANEPLLVLSQMLAISSNVRGVKSAYMNTPRTFPIPNPYTGSLCARLSTADSVASRFNSALLTFSVHRFYLLATFFTHRRDCSTLWSHGSSASSSSVCSHRSQQLGAVLDGHRLSATEVCTQDVGIDLVLTRAVSRPRNDYIGESSNFLPLSFALTRSR